MPFDARNARSGSKERANWRAFSSLCATRRPHCTVHSFLSEPGRQSATDVEQQGLFPVRPSVRPPKRRSAVPQFQQVPFFFFFFFMDGLLLLLLPPATRGVGRCRRWVPSLPFSPSGRERGRGRGGEGGMPTNQPTSHITNSWRAGGGRSAGRLATHVFSWSWQRGICGGERKEGGAEGQRGEGEWGAEASCPRLRRGEAGCEKGHYVYPPSLPPIHSSASGRVALGCSVTPLPNSVFCSFLSLKEWVIE